QWVPVDVIVVWVEIHKMTGRGQDVHRATEGQSCCGVKIGVLQSGFVCTAYVGRRGGVREPQVAGSAPRIRSGFYGRSPYEVQTGVVEVVVRKVKDREPSPCGVSGRIRVCPN